MYRASYRYLSISILRNKIFPFSLTINTREIYRTVGTYAWYGILNVVHVLLFLGPDVKPRLCSTTHQQIYFI
jgi:hypothetical protein